MSLGYQYIFNVPIAILAGSAVPEDVTMDKWYQPVEQPLFWKPFLFNNGSFLDDPARLLDPENPTMDKWMPVYPDRHERRVVVIPI